MAHKRVVKTERAAITGGPYSQAIIHEGLVYVSGQGAISPETNKVRLGTIEEEGELTLYNLRSILEEAGSSLDKVLKITVFLLDLKDYDRFNAIYRAYFKSDLPARTCVQAGNLLFGTRVEIDAIAYT
jgi:2-iminobutanoate/2-iminopropanoate deaminase